MHVSRLVLLLDDIMTFGFPYSYQDIFFATTTMRADTVRADKSRNFCFFVGLEYVHADARREKIEPGDAHRDAHCRGCLRHLRCQASRSK